MVPAVMAAPRNRDGAGRQVGGTDLLEQPQQGVGVDNEPAAAVDTAKGLGIGGGLAVEPAEVFLDGFGGAGQALMVPFDSVQRVIHTTVHPRGHRQAGVNSGVQPQCWTCGAAQGWVDI
jgi:hypothetical protein